jgi:hypothetical protein
VLSTWRDALLDILTSSFLSELTRRRWLKA